MHDLQIGYRPPCPRATGEFLWSAEQQDHGNLLCTTTGKINTPVIRDIDHRVQQLGKLRSLDLGEPPLRNDRDVNDQHDPMQQGRRPR